MPAERQRDPTPVGETSIRSSWDQVGPFGSRPDWGLARLPPAYLIRRSVNSPLSPKRVSPDSCTQSPMWGKIRFRGVRVPSEKERRYEDRTAHRHRAWLAAGSRPRRRRSLARLDPLAQQIDRWEGP
jgi:hypothetical protein